MIHSMKYFILHDFWWTFMHAHALEYHKLFFYQCLMLYNYDINGFFDDKSSIFNRTHFVHHVVHSLHDHAIEKNPLFCCHKYINIKIKRHVSQREAVTNLVLAFDCKICWKCGFSLKLIYENDIFCSTLKLPLIGLLTCIHKV